MILTVASSREGSLQLLQIPLIIRPIKGTDAKNSGMMAVIAARGFPVVRARWML